MHLREKFEKFFIEIEDTRCQCDVTHNLVDVLIIFMCSVLGGLDKLSDIVTYGKEKGDFLKKNFGIVNHPSKSTSSRVMNMIDGEKMAECIVGIMQDLVGTEGEIIAIDGKTIRSTAKKNTCKEKLHIITAYLTENGVTLGQLAVNEKTNEIPIIRELLEMIDIEGKTVTADAMHCQKETVKKIIDGKGDYVLGLKGNQGTAFDEISTYIDDCINDKTANVQSAKSAEKNKDRFEQRTCYKAPELDWFEGKSEWVGLKTAFAIHRRVRTKGGVSEEISYYISSKDETPERFLEIVREHWKIESMHWQLDVVFSEDECAIFSANGLKSMNAFRKLSLAIHKKYISELPQKTKPSTRNNMLKALISDDMLLAVLRTGL